MLIFSKTQWNSYLPWGPLYYRENNMIGIGNLINIPQQSCSMKGKIVKGHT